MEPSAFVQAILAEPEDNTHRLVFADWLEEHGQEARASWIRASCQLAGIHYNDPAFYKLIEQERDCFQRCRPAWWQEVTGVMQNNDRGMFRFEIRSKTAASRIGKIPWLGDAVAEGWLEGIAITWCDGSLARVLAGWKGAVREIPLFVRPAPQIMDEGLAFYLSVPQLWSLDLPGKAALNPSIARLGRRTDLRKLRLDGMYEGSEAVLMQVGQLSGLRQLTIKGYERPTDEELKPLGGLLGLRELCLSRCVALTDAGLTSLHRLTGLRRLLLESCAGISDAGVAELQRALPALKLERE